MIYKGAQAARERNRLESSSGSGAQRLVDMVGAQSAPYVRNSSGSYSYGVTPGLEVGCLIAQHRGEDYHRFPQWLRENAEAASNPLKQVIHLEAIFFLFSRPVPFVHNPTSLIRSSRREDRRRREKAMRGGRILRRSFLPHRVIR